MHFGAVHDESQAMPCGAIVAVAQLVNGNVTITDTKNPGQTGPEFTGREWSDFVRGVEAGEFDV